MGGFNDYNVSKNNYDNGTHLEGESQLLLRLKDGDTLAFELIYDRYKAQLANNLIKLLRDDELAKDALQDLFIRIWNSRKNIDPSKSIKSYMYRIAENLVIDYYRKLSKDKEMQARILAEKDHWYDQIGDIISISDNTALLYRVIDQLPPKQKEAFVLHKIEGKSYKEISQLMGISHSTINKHIYVANKFVKSQIIKSPEILKSLIIIFLFKAL